MNSRIFTCAEPSFFLALAGLSRRREASAWSAVFDADHFTGKSGSYCWDQALGVWRLSCKALLARCSDRRSSRSKGRHFLRLVHMYQPAIRTLAAGHQKINQTHLIPRKQYHRWGWWPPDLKHLARYYQGRDRKQVRNWLWLPRNSNPGGQSPEES